MRDSSGATQERYRSATEVRSAANPRIARPLTGREGGTPKVVLKNWARIMEKGIYFLCT